MCVWIIHESYTIQPCMTRIILIDELTYDVTTYESSPNHIWHSQVKQGVCHLCTYIWFNWLFMDHTCIIYDLKMKTIAKGWL